VQTDLPSTARPLDHHRCSFPGGLSAETGLSHVQAAAGEYVAGDYRRRLTLSSGRFAMIDDGPGFSLVPRSPSLDRHLGRHVSGVARDDGGVYWSFGRKRGAWPIPAERSGRAARSADVRFAFHRQFVRESLTASATGGGNITLKHATLRPPIDEA
jgi:hypothetical protein